MRLALALGICLVAAPGLARPQIYTCAQIRQAAQFYGVSALVSYARQQGYSEKQIRQAMLCLKQPRAR